MVLAHFLVCVYDSGVRMATTHVCTYVCVCARGIIVSSSSILVAASKHHVEHGTYSVLRPAGIAGGDVK